VLDGDHCDRLRSYFGDFVWYVFVVLLVVLFRMYLVSKSVLNEVGVRWLFCCVFLRFFGSWCSVGLFGWVRVM